MTILATQTGANGMPSKVIQSLRGFITRTNTVSKDLFTLPKNARVLFFTVWGKAASDAGTSANISIGKSQGTGAEYLSAYDVKTAATGNGLTLPNAQLLIGYDTTPTDTAKLSVDTTVNAKYAETGTVSTVGGPWTIEVFYVTGLVMEG